jgi:hypothetical protein
MNSFVGFEVTSFRSLPSTKYFKPMASFAPELEYNDMFGEII